MIYNEKDVEKKGSHSLIVQATVGCSYNKCTFCTEYKEDSFRIRDFKEIIKDLALARERTRHVDKVFISDGDPLSMDSDDLVKIMKAIKILFPENKEISIPGTARSILDKSLDELLELKKAGLDTVYMGLETGNDLILEDIAKGINKEELVLAGKKVKHSELKLHTRVMIGIGGIRYSEDHALDTARALNRIKPDVIEIEDLVLDRRTPLHIDQSGESMTLLSPSENLLELKSIIDKLQMDEDTIVKGKNISGNKVFYGVLPGDKNSLIEEIDRDILELDSDKNKDKRI